jgi:hypothetical protein
MAFWRPGTTAPGSSIDREAEVSSIGGVGTVTGRVLGNVAVSERRGRLPIAKQRTSQSQCEGSSSHHLQARVSSICSSSTRSSSFRAQQGQGSRPSYHSSSSKQAGHQRGGPSESRSREGGLGVSSCLRRELTSVGQGGCDISSSACCRRSWVYLGRRRESFEAVVVLQRLTKWTGRIQHSLRGELLLCRRRDKY